MEINLKEFRERALDLSQQEFAERLGVTQNTVSRWESDPTSLSIAKVMEIALTFGVQVTDILQTEHIPNEPWKVEDNRLWDDIKEKMNNIETEIIATEKLLDNRDFSKYHVFENLAKQKITLLENIRSSSRKPSISFTGAVDVGKSTAINTLLGDEALPAKWTPTTSAGAKLVHIKDKPVHMESNNTAVFATKADEPLIRTELLYDKTYFTEHLVTMGSRNLINEFGTHEGESFKKLRGDREILYTIVTYLDAPILNHCEIWDIPGVEASSNEDLSDDFVANSYKQGADVVIYLSVSNQFMHKFDMIHLKDAIDHLPRYDVLNNQFKPFENLFIIASQAKIVTSNVKDNDIKRLMKRRIEEFGKTLPDNYWEKLIGGATTKNHSDEKPPVYSIDDIQARAFTFEREDSKLQEEFKNALTKLLSKLAQYKIESLEKKYTLFSEEFNRSLEKQSTQLNEYLKDSEKAKHEYEKFLQEKPINIKRNEEMVDLIKNKATELKENSLYRISQYFDSEIQIENIEKLIKEKGFGKKREGKEQFINYFQNNLSSKADDILKENSTKFTQIINDQLESYERENLTLNISTFDYTSAFIGALSSVATYGAFAFYFSTLGNLGGYIFIAKVVSVLSSLGISLGGTATVASVVAAIGGPFTLVVAAAVIIGAGTAWLVGASWEKAFAKEIVKQFNKKFTTKTTDKGEHIGKTYKEVILNQVRSYWEETTENINTEMFNNKVEEEEAILKEQAHQNPTEYEETNYAISQLSFE